MDKLLNVIGLSVKTDVNINMYLLKKFVLIINGILLVLVNPLDSRRSLLMKNKMYESVLFVTSQIQTERRITL
jgi:hypothetical protein